MLDYTGKNPEFLVSGIRVNASMLTNNRLVLEDSVFHADSIAAVTAVDSVEVEVKGEVIYASASAATAYRLMCIVHFPKGLSEEVVLSYQSLGLGNSIKKQLDGYLAGGTFKDTDYYSVMSGGIQELKTTGDASDNDTLNELLVAIGKFAGAQSGSVGEDLNARLQDYQLIIDNALNTTSNKVEEAINELHGLIEASVVSLSQYQSLVDEGFETDTKNAVEAVGELLGRIGGIGPGAVGRMTFGGMLTSNIDLTSQLNANDKVWIVMADNVTVTGPYHNGLSDLTFNAGATVYYDVAVNKLYYTSGGSDLSSKQDVNDIRIPGGNLVGGINTSLDNIDRVTGAGKYKLLGYITDDIDLGATPVTEDGYFIVTAESALVYANFDDGDTSKQLDAGVSLTYSVATSEYTVKSITSFPVPFLPSVVRELISDDKRVEQAINQSWYDITNVANVDLLYHGGELNSDVSLPGPVEVSTLWFVNAGDNGILVTGEWSGGVSGGQRVYTGDSVWYDHSEDVLHLKRVGSAVTSKQDEVDPALAPTGTNVFYEAVNLLNRKRRELEQDFPGFVGYIFANTDLTPLAIGSSDKWWLVTGECTVTGPNGFSYEAKLLDRIVYTGSTGVMTSEAATITPSQPALDRRLNTKDKSLVGAINEVSKGASGSAHQIGDHIRCLAKVAPPNVLPKGIKPVLRKDYPLLFEQLGERYGAGDGINTFGIPPIDVNDYPVALNDGMNDPKLVPVRDYGIAMTGDVGNIRQLTYIPGFGAVYCYTFTEDSSNGSVGFFDVCSMSGARNSGFRQTLTLTGREFMSSAVAWCEYTKRIYFHTTYLNSASAVYHTRFVGHPEGTPAVHEFSGAGFSGWDVLPGTNQSWRCYYNHETGIALSKANITTDTSDGTVVGSSMTYPHPNPIRSIFGTNDWNGVYIVDEEGDVFWIDWDGSKSKQALIVSGLPQGAKTTGVGRNYDNNTLFLIVKESSGVVSLWSIPAEGGAAFAAVKIRALKDVGGVMPDGRYVLVAEDSVLATTATADLYTERYGTVFKDTNISLIPEFSENVNAGLTSNSTTRDGKYSVKTWRDYYDSKYVLRVTVEHPDQMFTIYGNTNVGTEDYRLSCTAVYTGTDGLTYLLWGVYDGSNWRHGYHCPENGANGATYTNQAIHFADDGEGGGYAFIPDTGKTQVWKMNRGVGRNHYYDIAQSDLSFNHFVVDAKSNAIYFPKRHRGTPSDRLTFLQKLDLATKTITNFSRMPAYCEGMAIDHKKRLIYILTAPYAVHAGDSTDVIAINIDTGVMDHVFSIPEDLPPAGGRGGNLWIQDGAIVYGKSHYRGGGGLIQRSVSFTGVDYVVCDPDVVPSQPVKTALGQAVQLDIPDSVVPADEHPNIRTLEYGYGKLAFARQSVAANNANRMHNYDPKENEWNAGTGIEGGLTSASKITMVGDIRFSSPESKYDDAFLAVDQGSSAGVDTLYFSKDGVDVSMNGTYFQALWSSEFHDRVYIGGTTTFTYMDEDSVTPTALANTQSVGHVIKRFIKDLFSDTFYIIDTESRLVRLPFGSKVPTVLVSDTTFAFHDIKQNPRTGEIIALAGIHHSPLRRRVLLRINDVDDFEQLAEVDYGYATLTLAIDPETGDVYMAPSGSGTYFKRLKATMVPIDTEVVAPRVSFASQSQVPMPDGLKFLDASLNSGGSISVLTHKADGSKSKIITAGNAEAAITPTSPWGLSEVDPAYTRIAAGGPKSRLAFMLQEPASAATGWNSRLIEGAHDGSTATIVQGSYTDIWADPRGELMMKLFCVSNSASMTLYHDYDSGFIAGGELTYGPVTSEFYQIHRNLYTDRVYLARDTQFNVMKVVISSSGYQLVSVGRFDSSDADWTGVSFKSITQSKATGEVLFGVDRDGDFEVYRLDEIDGVLKGTLLARIAGAFGKYTHLVADDGNNRVWLFGNQASSAMVLEAPQVVNPNVDIVPFIPEAPKTGNLDTKPLPTVTSGGAAITGHYTSFGAAYKDGKVRVSVIAEADSVNNKSTIFALDPETGDWVNDTMGLGDLSAKYRYLAVSGAGSLWKVMMYQHYSESNQRTYVILDNGTRTYDYLTMVHSIHGHESTNVLWQLRVNGTNSYLWRSTGSSFSRVGTNCQTGTAGESSGLLKDLNSERIFFVCKGKIFVTDTSSTEAVNISTGLVAGNTFIDTCQHEETGEILTLSRTGANSYVIHQIMDNNTFVERYAFTHDTLNPTYMVGAGTAGKVFLFGDSGEYGEATLT